MPDIIGGNIVWDNQTVDFAATTDEQTVYSIGERLPYEATAAIIISNLQNDTEINVKHGSGKAYSRIWSRTDSRSEFDPGTFVIVVRLDGVRTPRTINMRSLTAEGSATTIACRSRVVIP